MDADGAWERSNSPVIKNVAGKDTLDHQLWKVSPGTISPECGLFVNILKKRQEYFYSGPVSVGRNHPTTVVAIHTTTAINRDLSQPTV